MNKTILSIALALATLSATGIASAQDRNGREDQQRQDRRDDSHGQYQRQEQGGNRDRHQNHRDNQDQGRSDRSNDHASRDGERGAGPEHNFYRGERLPAEYRNQQYRVDDWRGHRLSAPPRGQHWVQVGGDYVLAANNTGIILQLLLGQ
jgi:Ni/Co efflux regulator RcnB